MVTWYEHALSQYIFDLAGCSLACRDERLIASAVKGGAFGVCVEVIGCGVDSNELLLISRRMRSGLETRVLLLSMTLAGQASASMLKPNLAM